jgi:hypothetical protein
MLWIARPETTRSKTAVCKGQHCHVARVQPDPIRHPFGDSLAPGRLGRISRLIGAWPQVDSYDPARGQALSSHEQDRTPPNSFFSSTFLRRASRCRMRWA